ncbi:MAG: right-handed parallel beta-helix repeat-containing protein, partial [Planctomycetota bacterium]
MTERPATLATLSRILKLLVITSVAVFITQAKASEDSLLSSCPAIDTTGKAFAEGRLDVAAQRFEAISRDASAPSFARGLALFGSAEVALARQDPNAAIAAWDCLAADEKLLRFHRDTAMRRIAEAKRLQKGLPARDPASYRVQLPVVPAPGKVFHVAPTGSDTADGSQRKPFRTLERARDAVRSLKQSRSGKPPAGGVRIEIGGGEYPWERTLKLTSEDSGTAGMPIVYQVDPGRTAVFRGGVQITAWRPISDAKIRDKLDARIRDRVMEANLKALGVEDLGDATALHRCPELFVDGKPQALARWPNTGFVKTGDILGKETFKVWNRIEGCRDGKFAYVEDRPSSWLDEPDVRLYGYWFWDWFEEFQKVESIDREGRTFTLYRPYSRYGYREDQRYYALNVFCELDIEGEWYLDRRTAKVYWLAPEGIEVSKAETVLSVFDQPFVTMTDVEHVILRGFTLQEGRGNGIHIRGGADCRVANCTIRRLGGDAIIVEGGQHHSIFGCTMHTLGCGGMRVAGGDRNRLTPGRHFVENCRVFD